MPVPPSGTHRPQFVPLHMHDFHVKERGPAEGPKRRADTAPLTLPNKKQKLVGMSHPHLKQKQSGQGTSAGGQRLGGAQQQADKTTHTLQTPVLQPPKTIQPASQKALIPFPNGIDIVIAHREQGIPEQDIRNLAQYAGDHNLIIGIRPVERLAKSLLATNQYPTKNFHIKGKSSSWGPMASFIPVNQRYSKVEKSEEKIRKYSNEIDEVLRKEIAVAVDLALSPQRLQELVKERVIEIVKKSEAGEITQLTSKAPSGKEYTFSAQLKNGEYKIFDGSGEPVEVLGYEGIKKPIVPDYDLLSVAPAMSHLDHLDNRPIKDVSLDVLKKRVSKYPGERNDANLRKYVDNPKNKSPYLADSQKIRDYVNDPQSFYKAEDKNLGNVSPRIKAMVTDITESTNINTALGCVAGLEKVHHNADEASPATDYESNYPATFFFPKEMEGIDKVAMVNNVKDMAHVIQVALDNGYHVMRNPLWEKEITSIRRTAFREAQSKMEEQNVQLLKRTAIEACSY